MSRLRCDDEDVPYWVLAIRSFVAFLLVAGLITLIICAIVSMVKIERWRPQPRNPEFNLVSFTLTGINVTASTQQVGGYWGARFQIKSNYSVLEYQDLESSVSYNGEVLSRTDILAFNQAAHNLTLIEVHYSALDALIGQRDAIVSPATVTALTADLARGSVGFDVRVVGKVSTSEQLQVLCGVVPITISQDGVSGKFNRGPQKCEVKVEDLPRTYRP